MAKMEQMIEKIEEPIKRGGNLVSLDRLPLKPASPHIFNTPDMKREWKPQKNGGPGCNKRTNSLQKPLFLKGYMSCREESVLSLPMNLDFDGHKLSILYAKKTVDEANLVSIDEKMADVWDSLASFSAGFFSPWWMVLWNFAGNLNIMGPQVFQSVVISQSGSKITEYSQKKCQLLKLDIYKSRLLGSCPSYIDDMMTTWMFMSSWSS